MGGEIYAFAEQFYIAFMLRHDLETICQMDILIQICADSLEMFHVVAEASSTTEKRLMIDVAGAHESRSQEDIFNVGLIISEQNM